MKGLRHILGSCLIATALTGCGEDDYVYPSIRTEMVCLKTNSGGVGIQLMGDDGSTWNLAEGNRPDGLTADSTYRVLSKFETTGDSDAKVYTLQQVISPIPQAAETMQTDPVSIQSIWQSGEYLNMVLQVMMKDEKHELWFVDKGITTDSDGTQTLTIALHHNRKDDVEGFYRKAYLSVPLWHYADRLNKGDQVVFQLNTYEEGMTSRTFTY